MLRLRLQDAQRLCWIHLWWLQDDSFDCYSSPPPQQLSAAARCEGLARSPPITAACCAPAMIQFFNCLIVLVQRLCASFVISLFVDLLIDLI